MEDELRGVKGWLLTFVIIMAVISPLAVIGLVIRDLYGDPMVQAAYGTLWPSIESFEWTHAIVTILACWFVAWRLVTVHNWLSVRIAIAGIWLIAVGGVLTELLGVSLITGVAFGDLFGASASPGLFRPLIFCGIWTAYLLKSRRVANTYRDPGEQAEVFE
jgi:hypothetical protein